MARGSSAPVGQPHHVPHALRVEVADDGGAAVGPGVRVDELDGGAVRNGRESRILARLLLLRRCAASSDSLICTGAAMGAATGADTGAIGGTVGGSTAAGGAAAAVGAAPSPRLAM